jgi:integrase
MTSANAPRRRGSIRARGGSLQVRVSSGADPLTGERAVLTATVHGTDRAAWREAEKQLTRLQHQVDQQRVASSAVSLSEVLAEWLRTSELEDSTRKTYAGYIARTIVPALGQVPVRKLDARMLETFYAQLRRCRQRCDARKSGKRPSASLDQLHVCQPLAVSTVRQMHWVISGALAAATRWGWVNGNCAKDARVPRSKPPDPRPPTPEQAARLVQAAFAMDPDWGTLVWLAMATGIRRGELCALRFSSIHFDEETLDLRRNWVGGREKDTKTHQARRIALDATTLGLLHAHRERVQARVESLGGRFTDDLFLFAGLKTVDHTEPYSPNAVTQRYKDMAARIGIATYLHALRHYSATELLTSGVDLRTVAGRLGHGGGGTTTLKVYAAWVAGADRKAAELLASRMPPPTYPVQ